MSRLYFQPQYVNRFRCDGSKCDAKCCKGWRIYVDAATYQKYPPHVRAHLHFDAEHNLYKIAFNDKKACPLLTADNLCGLQLQYGEDFLSETCATFPRYTFDFGDFFERSLTLSCPVAAELILFERAPMQFELVDVAAESSKIVVTPVACGEGLAKRMLEAQIAMISILQERTLSIDQRLIVLAFFLDKLDEITAGGVNEFALKKLVDAYESKKFLAEQVPSLLRTVRFDPRTFTELMLKLFNALCGDTDCKYVVDARRIAADYQRLGNARDKFLANYSVVLENYLVNELLVNCYPWRFNDGIAINCAIFLTAYKMFELILFAATIMGLSDQSDLLNLVAWFEEQSVHCLDGSFHRKIFAQIGNDLPTLMDSLLRGDA